MSYYSIYKKYNALTSDVKIEIKRKNINGSYEENWVNLQRLIANQVITQDSIRAMSYKLPNSSFAFGIVRIPECTLRLLSIFGEFDKESNFNSIFYGYIRHETQVKISHGYLDYQTGNYEYLEVYRGFINDESVNTKASNQNAYQDLFIEDMFVYLLKKYTYSDFTITSTTLEALVYELLNRSEFTDFLSIDVANIDAGYDVQNIDFTEIEGQTQWLTILQDLSIGHSYMYQKNSVIYYQRINSKLNVAKFFGKDKIISLEMSSSGIEEVYERLYWKDTGISYIAPNIQFNKSKTFEIESITNSTDRGNILATVGTRISTARKQFKVKIVLFTELYLLERVRIKAGDYELAGGLIWNVGNWDEENWASNLGASFTNESLFYMIREINHNFDAGTTELLIEEI